MYYVNSVWMHATTTYIYKNKSQKHSISIQVQDIVNIPLYVTYLVSRVHDLHMQATCVFMHVCIQDFHVQANTCKILSWLAYAYYTCTCYMHVALSLSLTCTICVLHAFYGTFSDQMYSARTLMQKLQNLWYMCKQPATQVHS